jgi:hypothetical protein
VSLTQEFWDTFRKLSALEARTEDMVHSLQRVHDKMDYMLDRLSRIEIQYETLRQTVRNEILADLKAEIAVLKFAMAQPLGSAPSQRVQEVEASTSALLTGE